MLRSTLRRTSSGSAMIGLSGTIFAADKPNTYFDIGPTANPPPGSNFFTGNGLSNVMCSYDGKYLAGAYTRGDIEAATRFGYYTYPIIMGVNYSADFQANQYGDRAYFVFNNSGVAYNPVLGTGFQFARPINYTTKQFLFVNPSSGVITHFNNVYSVTSGTEPTMGPSIAEASWNWCNVKGPAPNPRVGIVKTMFAEGPSPAAFSVTWDNPALDTDLQNSTADFATAYPSIYGFVNAMKGRSYTFEGRVINNPVIVTSPDGETYQVIEIVPLDATAATWANGAGEVRAMYDDQGSLWLKNVNNDRVFTGAGAVLLQLPIYPPISLPSPVRDLDNAMKTIRSTK